MEEKQETLDESVDYLVTRLDGTVDHVKGSKYLVKDCYLYILKNGVEVATYNLDQWISIRAR